MATKDARFAFSEPPKETQQQARYIQRPATMHRPCSGDTAARNGPGATLLLVDATLEVSNPAP